MAQEVIKIRGGQALKGEVEISGAKIVQLLLSRNFISSRTSKVGSLPQISDVETLVSLLEDLNIEARLNGKQLEVDTNRECTST